MSTPEIVQVAVYGDLREGMPEHAALAGKKRLGKGRIAGYQLFAIKGQAIAIPVKGNTIVAEVWQTEKSVLEQSIADSDWLTDTTEVPTPWGMALIAIGRVNGQAVPITTGDWRDFSPSDQKISFNEKTGTAG